MNEREFSAASITTQKRESDFQALTEEAKNAIRQLEIPLRDIARQLKQELLQHQFDLIIGDDASGRIPAWILWKVARSSPEKAMPALRFYAGSRNLVRGSDDWHTKETAMNAHIATLPRHGMKKALIVTDVLETGDGISMLLEQLKANGWTVTVATVGIPQSSSLSADESLEGKRKTLQDKLGVPIVVGFHGVPAIFRTWGYDEDRGLGGVSKSPENLFAERNGLSDQQIAAVRRLADKVADKIVTDLRDR